MTLLQVQHLTCQFGGLTAVSDVSLSVQAETITSLIGPNGAGKSTFFNLVTGLYAPSSGRIQFGDVLLADGRRRTPPHRVSRLGIARTYQNLRLFASLSARENVLVGLHAHLRSPLWACLLHTPAAVREEAWALQTATDLLAEVGLAGHEAQVASSLSYGDQRRLEIARALAQQPRLLMLDEPAAGLNASESAALVGLLRGLRDRRRLAILLIEHDMNVVMDISEHVFVLDHGVLIAEGTPQAVRQHPQVIEAYLGTGHG